MKALPLLSAAFAFAVTAPAQTPAAPSSGSPAAPATAPADIRALLRDALFEEEATRDLTKAAAGYEALLAAWNEQRPTAAAALFRLAEVRRKQDRKDDAIALYQRLLREFPDIEPHAKLARENLTALGGSDAPPSPVPADSLTTAEEATALQRIKKLAAQSPDLLRGKEFTNACENSWLTVLEFLISKGVTDNGDGISEAAFNGHLAIVQALIKQKPDTAFLTNAVDGAASAGRLAVLKALFEAGASPEGSHPNYPALWIALDKGYTDAARLLLDSKANPDPAGAATSPLFAAVRTQNVTMVKQLLALKADPNRATRRPDSPENSDAPRDMLMGPNGSTPLHAAVSTDNAEIIRLLLDAKANPNAVNEAGWTPLRGAVEKKDLSLVEQLLAAGADPNLADKGNETPLYKAVSTKQRDIAVALLKAKADPNALLGKEKNRSAFYHVFTIREEAGLAAWITLFLEHGADPFLPPNPPIDSATPEWRIKLLRSHKYPALAAKPAITVAFGDAAYCSTLLERKEDAQKPGLLRALLADWYARGAWRIPNRGRFEQTPDWSTLRLWRKGADGKMQETLIEVKKETAWPELHWGDVIEVCANGRNPGRPPAAEPVPEDGAPGPDPFAPSLRGLTLPEEYLKPASPAK